MSFFNVPVIGQTVSVDMKGGLLCGWHGPRLVLKMDAAGLDLVEVREELSSFAAGYAYSFVGQTFIQRADSQIVTKHLMTLNISHILVALRKHGSSFAEAVVDSIFKLLTKQTLLLSQVPKQAVLSFNL